ncbi:MAG: sensor histidine kinase [Candidatus Binatia bacterium]
MRRFRVLFVGVSLVLLGLMALLVHRALGGVALERQMRHQAVAERVFDEMERALSNLLETEEARPLERYAIDVDPPPPSFVVGYFEVDSTGAVQARPAPRDNEIEQAVSGLWRAGGRPAVERKSSLPSQLPGTTVQLEEGLRQEAPAPRALGALAAKDEVSAFDALRSLNKGVVQRADRQKKAAELENPYEVYAGSSSAEVEVQDRRRTTAAHMLLDRERDTARPETDLPPMAGRVIDAGQLLVYRTVVRDARSYRQGLVLDVAGLGGWLREQGLGGDGLAERASVSFATPFTTAAAAAETDSFLYRHRFAEPFDDLSAELLLSPLPGVGGATYVYALSALLLATAILGLAALYRMAAVVVGYAERRSNFAAAVSHELKTPLTAIRMYGEMLRDGLVPSEEKRAEYYRNITVESERLTRLINNVLELSRLEQGARQVSLAVGPVEPVVREVADLLGPHAEKQGFELRVEVDRGLPPVRFERDALVQVLSNLVDNAVKYARDATAREIVLGARHEDGDVVLSVRDHGPGVPARHLARIFEPYYRGESELTRRSKGSGLGLALVRGLVERMDGRVAGRNAEEGGFEVKIAFRTAV